MPKPRIGRAQRWRRQPASASLSACKVLIWLSRARTSTARPWFVTDASGLTSGRRQGAARFRSRRAAGRARARRSLTVSPSGLDADAEPDAGKSANVSVQLRARTSDARDSDAGWLRKG
jgi:hypothetical protein